jgi:hypothetical protein
MKKYFLLVAGIVSAASSSLPAYAASRAFVSGKGTDTAGCGPVVTPCRTPQYAHDNTVSAGGEIDILDGAGYGSITINKAISIINDGAGLAGFLAPAGGNAITINAGPGDDITLRGLTIEGAGVGNNGLVFNTGLSLTMSNCVAQGFVAANSLAFDGNGILLTPTTSSVTIRISNSDASNNSDAGIRFLPPSGTTITARIIIDHVIATKNGSAGVSINAFNTSGTTVAGVSNTVASNQIGGVGFEFAGPNLTATLDTSNATGNLAGVAVEGATAYLSQNTITSNSQYGVQIASGGVANTFHDNRIESNPQNVSTGSSLVLANFK